MDFITQYIALDTLIYALLGIPAFVGFSVLVRLSRQGRASFEQRHSAMEARIEQTTAETEELNNTMRKEEQLHILATALHEACHILSAQEDMSHIRIEECNDAVYIHTKKHFFVVTYTEKIQHLRSTGKTVYGQGHFTVYGPFLPCAENAMPHIKQEKALKTFYSLMELELYLSQKLHSKEARSDPPALWKK